MKSRSIALALAVLAAGGLLWTRTSTSQGNSRAPASPPAQPTAQAARATQPPRTALPADDDKPKPNAGPTFFARWGGAPGELGRERPPEGNPVGPMSFAADARGRVTVLDGVNARLVRRGPNGELEQTFPIDVVNPEDLAVGPKGESAVLDRHRDKAVTVYDENGKARGKLPLEGEGISDTGSVTGVFVDGDDVYVEKEHASLVKIGSLSGTPASPRSEIPGRPSRDGRSFLKAGIVDAGAGRVFVASIDRAKVTQRFTRELTLASEVHHIALLDSDRHGTVYFAAEIAGGEVVLHCLDGSSGAPRGTTSLPANTLPEESTRDFVVLDDGGVIQALRSEQGVTYTRHGCQ